MSKTPEEIKAERMSKRLASGMWGYVDTTDGQAGITNETKTYKTLKEINNVPYSEGMPIVTVNPYEKIENGKIPTAFYDNSEHYIPTPNAQHSNPEYDTNYEHSGDTDMHWNDAKPEWNEFEDSVKAEEESTEETEDTTTDATEETE